ncbi:MAG TPA: hypothetical protein VGV37_29500 [Aliidongia sp.]|uniref:hypothetical protein n=1 Tax=Aliidongia sp. TaxID=1914230 RepID=UPI002DDDBAD8|nr:hypothetical protein [Aliidongia sp.]HEV2678700.1 hypothetical protein [Aliidongia sp.]
MIARLCGLALLGLALGDAVALADENSDLDLIPQAAGQPQTPTVAVSPGGAPNQRLYLENALTGSGPRGGLPVPFPPPKPATWQERLFLDARKQWVLGDRVTLTLSDRLNLRAESNLDGPGHQNTINDFREGYVSWEALDRTYLDAGRINLKNGAAVGFNPTDFFKTRAVVDPLSVDPTVLREDRLGTVMGFGERIWQGGTLMVAVAPKLTNPTAVYKSTDLRSFDPSFDRTNAHARFMVKGSADLAEDFAPELLLYHEADRTSVGTNLTRSVSQDVVVYAEWAGGTRSSLVDEALRYGRQTGTLPMNASSAIPESSISGFQSELSVGGSYTTESKITFNLEYHFNQAGFSRRDWNNWFRAGSSPGARAAITRELWYLRSYAAEQQEPLSEHSVFLRADRVDAFVPNLEITGFINADLYDGSSLAQVTADYYLSNAWTVGGLVIADLGRAHSDFGSLPQTASVLFRLARYF